MYYSFWLLYDSINGKIGTYNLLQNLHWKKTRKVEILLRHVTCRQFRYSEVFRPCDLLFFLAALGLYNGILTSTEHTTFMPKMKADQVSTVSLYKLTKPSPHPFITLLRRGTSKLLSAVVIRKVRGSCIQSRRPLITYLYRYQWPHAISTCN